MNASATTQRKYQIKGTHNGHFTTFSVLAWDYTDAVNKAKVSVDRITSVSLWQTKAEREADRVAAMRAYYLLAKA